MIRVGLTVPGGFELGGIGRAMLYLTEAWRTLPAAPRWTLIDPRGATASLMPLYLAKEVCRLTILKSIGQLDLLHINVAGRSSTVRKVILSEAAEHLGLPTIVHLHDYDYASDFSHRLPPIRDRVARMFRRARLVFVLGCRDATTVIKLIGCIPEQVVVLQNAVPDPASVPIGRVDRPATIVFVGDLDDRKGVPDLLCALDSDELRGRSWRLVMAGRGECSRFRSEIRQRDLTGRVEMTGWIPQKDVYKLLREADIFVLPTYAEGMALSVLEAMAHGKAIVTTPVGAHSEAVTHGKEALLVPPGCVRSLVGALAQLLDGPELRTSLGRAARRRYLENFEARDQATRIASLYAMALSGSDQKIGDAHAEASHLAQASRE